VYYFIILLLLFLKFVFIFSVLCAGLEADQLRPQFHVMPERYWMNDPNGPMFFNGLHHLFYQHNPDSIAWTNMHWYHTTTHTRTTHAFCLLNRALGCKGPRGVK
jgi:sucrose-6-phosphate hydrolase SacC (GH32 family)